MTARPALNYWEIGAALAVFVLGAFLVWQGGEYPFGSLTRMGPGFFPVMLGIILMGFGVVLLAEVRHLDTPPPELQARPFMAIFSGLLAFAFMLDRFGLIPAAIVLTAISALGDRPVRPRAIVATAAVVAAIGYFVFLRGFGLQLDAVRW